MPEFASVKILIGLLYHALVVTAVITALARKREPAAALGWSLAIVFLPVAGLAAFFTFGLTRLPRRLQRKIEHGTEFATDIARSGVWVADAAGRERFADHAQGWEGLDRLALNLGCPPRRPGHCVTLLERGRTAFARMFRAIESASHHVHVEKYIFRRDHLGREFAHLLAAAAARGVEVRIIIDAVGTIGGWSLLRDLRRRGVHGAEFMPLFPAGKRVMPNLRNHRKIVIVDGKTAFFGGLNVGDEYVPRRNEGRDWCDAHIMIEGPAVADVQRVFAEDWDFTTGQALLGDDYFPSCECPGAAPVQIVAGGPDRRPNPIRQVFFAAIARARDSIKLATPYLVPDPALRDALIASSLRGVDVTVLTQSWPPDHWTAFLAQRHVYGELLDAGITIREYLPGMMHAKFLVCDERWATLGSTNFDNRSMHLNFELNGVFEGPDEVAAISRRFTVESEHTRRFTLTDFERRPFLQRVAGRGAYLVSPLL